MPTPDEFSSYEEEENISRQLKDAWEEASFIADIEMVEKGPDGPTGLVIADLIPEYKGPVVEDITEAEAERSVVELLNTLSAAGVNLYRPAMVGSREFYTWLQEHFLQLEVDFVIGNGWCVNYHYTELVPDSPDTMSFYASSFLDDLFQLEREPEFWTLEAFTYDESGTGGRLPPRMQAYIDGWRLGLRCIEDYDYLPVSGTFVTETEAVFVFEVRANLIYKDGRTVIVDGRGEARMEFDGFHWSVKHIEFPGFRLPVG